MVYVPGAHRGQKTVSDFWELEIQMFMGHNMVLKSKLRSSEKAVPHNC